MHKSDRSYFFSIILAIFLAVTFLGNAKAEAQWEAEWQKTLEAAKKEGKVVVSVSSISPGLRKQAPIFLKQFGIEVEVMVDRGSGLIARLATEKRAGLNTIDALILGGNSIFDAKQLGVTEPMDNKLILPEVTNTKLWYTQDSLPWLDNAKHCLHFLAYPNRDITINTDLVKPGEINSWQDLLKPKFKGKIVWSDPMISGSGFNGFATLLLNKATDENYYRKMVATQDITLARDLRQMSEWLARGKYAVAVSVEGGIMSQFISAGAHIAYVRVKEGTYLSYDACNVTILAKAPHPNASKVFVNWLLSKAGQDFAQKATKYMSSRSDIPTEDVNPENRRIPGERYFVGCNTNEKWLAEDQDKSLALARDIFGPLSGR